MAADFSRFSSRSFEQFCQALALQVFGDGTIIFGSGPDGGREATFRGKVPFPSDADPWSGYGVIQAKYKEKAETTQKDQDWAIKYFEDELKAFVEKENRSPKPEYYVFVTNVVLTSVGETGGKDRAQKIFEQYAKKLPLKDYRIWDGEQLTSFLDNYSELRKRFTEFLTPGDVFAQLIKRFGQDKTDIVYRHMDNQLRAQRYAKLDQAGQRTDERTDLAKVFIDLPTTTQATQRPPEESLKEEGLPPGFLAGILHAGEANLDPLTQQELAERGEQNQQVRPDITRFVLMGGPGSGKSTLGQFLAQIHRAALLQRYNKPKIVETKNVINAVEGFCKQHNAPWPKAPRYPFHVDLSYFAGALARKDEPGAVSSLAQYIANKVADDSIFTTEDLYEWLAKNRCLLVLDGLDEVPASSNRGEVCTSIQNFLAAAAQRNADLLVLATTREEGYNDEFGRDEYEFRFLPPLSTPRALNYAQGFLKAKYGSDTNSIRNAYEILESAVQDHTTANLMRSPLQVTFMVTLVACGGHPPRYRWKLFDEYFNTIYQREKQKSGPLRAILADHEQLVLRMHQEVGFRLQQRGEDAGETAAVMPISEFEKLLLRRLAEDGHESPKKEAVCAQIVEAAMTRLVFLTSRIEGLISFEIRSLQEYMAAEYFSSLGQEKFFKVLKTIGQVDYWRNVFLLMAGKCFFDSNWANFRGSLLELCESLNEPEDNDPLVAMRRTGARIALQILFDGATTQTPIYSKRITQCALRLLELPPRPSRSGAALHIRLSEYYDTSREKEFKEVILRCLHNDGQDSSIGAWLLLVSLVESVVPWAVDIAQEHWPKDPKAAWAIIVAADDLDFNTPWLVDRAKTTLYSLRLCDFFEISFENPIVRKLMPFSEEIEWVKLVSRLGEQKKKLILNVGFVPLFSENVQTSCLDMLSSEPDIEESSVRYALYLITRYAEQPNKQTLADCLTSLTSGYSYDSLLGIRSLMPWPLAACIHKRFFSNGKYRALIAAIREGCLGDTGNWKAAEMRWQKADELEVDSSKTHEKDFPFDASIQDSGFAGFVSISSSSSFDGISNDLLSIPRYELRNNACVAFTVGFLDISCTPEEAKRLIKEGSFYYYRSESLRHIDFEAATTAELLLFTDWLGRRIQHFFFGVKTPDRFFQNLETAFLQNPSSQGTVRVLAAGYSQGFIPEIPTALLDLEKFECPRLKWAALCLRVCSKGLSEEEAHGLADDALGLLDVDADYSPSFEDIPKALLSGQRFGVGHLAFALDVRKALPAEAHRIQAEFDVYLSDAMRQREAGPALDKLLEQPVLA